MVGTEHDDKFVWQPGELVISDPPEGMDMDEVESATKAFLDKVIAWRAAHPENEDDGRAD